MKPILATMVYCIKDGDVLLMLRNKEPNLGLWVGPGGKLEPGESPYDCAKRELYEETGLEVNDLYFRGLITEISPRPDWQWLMFLYVATEFSGTIVEDKREGRLSWCSLSEVMQLPIPEADSVFFEKVTNINMPFYQAKFVYDSELNLVNVVEQ
ncbi:MAG: DNA mismatch repair protein MutT [Anaerolineaceae bacterium]|nr:DNA mismatch repair protein MutT [Anaerolineaceae bacterium]